MALGVDVVVDGHLPPARARARPLSALELGVGECCASCMARCSRPAEIRECCCCCWLPPTVTDELPVGDGWDRHMAANTLFM